MSYFIDFMPNESFLNKMKDLKEKIDDEIILNVYLKDLPAMNIFEDIYCNFEDGKKFIKEIKSMDLKVNIMIDVFCFGNKEFTKSGKKVFEIIDEIMQYNIDYVTVTNNLFYNYLKNNYKNTKIIMSEYCEIANVQKICRYLENIKSDGVKLDIKLILNHENMEYIKQHFDINNIYIDLNRYYYKDDIYRDYLYNSLSHYIQENRWQDAKACILDYENKQKDIGNIRMEIDEKNYQYLRELGYTNYWYKYNKNISEAEYIDDIQKIII